MVRDAPYLLATQHLAGSPVLSLTRWAQRGARCRAWARNIGPQPVVTPVGDLGTRGLQDKNQREGEGSPCRLFEPQIRSADRYQAGLPNVTARPHGAWECGWELPEYGLCGSSYFLGATHLVCLGVRIDPNCFAASHMRLEVEWEEISNTQLVGRRKIRRGQHSRKLLDGNFRLECYPQDSQRKNLTK